MDKIDAIFIQTYSGELLKDRLYTFLDTNYNRFVSLPNIYIFTDHLSAKLFPRNKKLIQIIESLNIHVVYTDSSRYKNGPSPYPRTQTAYTFYTMMNHEIDVFKNVLILETDCVLQDDFTVTINKDLPRYEKYWIYGSYYYGINPWAKDCSEEQQRFRQRHINGVAVYNRNSEMLAAIEDALFRANRIDSLKDHYDFTLHKYFHKNITKKSRSQYFIDSKHILNISCNCDKNLDWKQIKPGASIIHQKTK